MEREELLARMARRLGGPRRNVPAPPRWLPPAELFMHASEARQVRFLERLRRLGVQAQTVATRGEAQVAVERLMSEHHWQLMSCPTDLAWPSVAGRLGDDDSRLPFGLVEAEWALAETGTVVLFPGGRQRRATSLVPPVVGFFVRKSRIVSRLTDVLTMFDAASSVLPANVVFVSGPSRSADIGSVVCKGVHGPGEVHAWVIEQE